VPTTKRDAERLWEWAKSECLENFGPFEDAMSVNSHALFHTRISALVNICRLNPGRLLEEVAAMDIPFGSKEGFIRQILGWREFMHLVHSETDGFRSINGESQPIRDKPGDGGYRNWQGTGWLTEAHEDDPDGGAHISFLGSTEPVPKAYWGAESGLKCLDTVVSEVWQNAYSHHITRLMILSNIGTMVDLSPRDLTDWFWVAYIDAFDWVVEPNVLGMGTFGLGGLFTTKPYIAGSAYIDKMSDYCRHCQFDPKTNCPITSLYWAFLARHEDQLKNNQRIAMPLNSMRKRAPEKKARDTKIFQYIQKQLRQGEPIKREEVARILSTD
jgi:deoxyribodipyrimidine photolyase-related protein